MLLICVAIKSYDCTIVCFRMVEIIPFGYSLNNGSKLVNLLSGLFEVIMLCYI
jgi:hypothetical protein